MTTDLEELLLAAEPEAMAKLDDLSAKVTRRLHAKP
jgi:hypothetical protein